MNIRAGDGVVLRGYAWTTASPPRAIVQLAHGAAEHLHRYDRFARKLAESGIAVVGADHRGHGANAVHGLANFGPAGFGGVVDDMAVVARAATNRFAGMPLILFGHSMGSFASQVFLAEHGDLLSGLILSGTAAIDELIDTGVSAAGLQALNANFEPARTPFDWLSRDEDEVDAYMADPLCGFDIAPASLATMPAVVTGVRRKERLASALARDLPILLISGEMDPVGGPGQESTRRVAEQYRSAGLGDVEHRIYPGGRHELLHDIDREQVTDDVITWLGRFPPSRK